ncbi:MAG: metalloregulator ArsR/SmtB family transcription factor [Pseudomonadota bacterium]
MALKKAKNTQARVDHELASRRFRILGDKNRLAIFKFLMKNPCPVGDIAIALGIGRTLVSHNLKILRSEGLVDATRNGKNIIYKLADELKIENHETLDLECCRVSFS